VSALTLNVFYHLPVGDRMNSGRCHALDGSRHDHSSTVLASLRTAATVYQRWLEPLFNLEGVAIVGREVRKVCLVTISYWLHRPWQWEKEKMVPKKGDARLNDMMLMTRVEALREAGVECLEGTMQLSRHARSGRSQPHLFWPLLWRNHHSLGCGALWAGCGSAAVRATTASHKLEIRKASPISYSFQSSCTRLDHSM
jgi:hypothetical protein